MKRYQNYQAAEDAAIDATRAATAAEACLAAILNDGDVSGWVRDGEYAMKVVEPKRSNGGYVILRWRCKGQRDSIDVWELDRFCSYARNLCSMDQDAMSVRHLAEVAHKRQYDALFAEVAA